MKASSIVIYFIDSKCYMIVFNEIIIISIATIVQNS